MQIRNIGIYFFIIAFLATLFALFTLYAPFLMNLLIAFLLFIATQSIYDILLKSIKSQFLSACIMVLGLLIICIAPIFYVLLNLANFATNLNLGNFQNFLLDTQNYLIASSKSLLEYLPEILQKEINNYLEQLHSIQWGDILKRAFTIIATASKNSLSFLSDTFFILIFLFFFYFYYKSFKAYLLRLIPFNPEKLKAIYAEVSAVINVVFYSSIISMFLQGFLFGLLMLFYGYNAYLLGVFYGFASLVPIIGGTLVWLPVAGYEAYLGNYANALIISLYSIIVIATLADNGVKPFIIAFINRVFIKTPVKINEMLIFFAIIAGLTSFGFWGIVLGPTITALFIALLRIYQHLLQDHKENFKD